ncbi:unnamed protein product, partial [Brassica rapa]
DTHIHTRTATDVLCVLADTHRHPPTWNKITQTVHGKGQRAESKDQLHRKGQRAESKDQRADMCTDGQPQTSCTSCVCLRIHTTVLCVLTDTHERPVCADRHTRTHTDVLCVLTDSHKQPQTSCV